MTKETKFMWGWKDYAPQPDPHMTRERAARLLRAWRRSATQGRKNFYLKRIGKGIYQVSCRTYPDTSTMIIGGTK